MFEQAVARASPTSPPAAVGGEEPGEGGVAPGGEGAPAGGRGGGVRRDHTDIRVTWTGHTHLTPVSSIHTHTHT